MKRGAYIAIEGVDGAGKTTQARLLAQALTAERGEGSVVLVREPGGTPLGERVRAILLDNEPRVKMCPRAELMLFMAARAQLAADVIEPALASGKVVVSDRSWISSVVYQGGLGLIGANNILCVTGVALGNLSMDLLVLLDASPRKSFERMRAAGKTNAFDEMAKVRGDDMARYYCEAFDLFAGCKIRIEADEAEHEVQGSIAIKVGAWLRDNPT